MRTSKKDNFQIIGGGGHGGMSSMNFSHLSSILLTENSAKVDLGLIHAKGRVEKAIQFKNDQTIVDHTATRYAIVWLTVREYEQGKGYEGLAACMMLIDEASRKGYKNLSHHVNMMDEALKGKINIECLTAGEKTQLLSFLQTHRISLWENSPVSFKDKVTKDFA